MFIVIVERCISAKAGVQDWYILLAIALPFKPSVGFEAELKPEVFATMERVVYRPADGTFWAQVEPFLHPKPNAEVVAKQFVEAGWDKAVVEKDLKVAKDSLRKDAVKKLQRAIMRVQPSVIQGPVNLAFDPRGKGRKH